MGLESYLNGHPSLEISRAGFRDITALKHAPLTVDVHVSQVLYIENGKNDHVISTRQSALNTTDRKDKRAPYIYGDTCQINFS